MRVVTNEAKIRRNKQIAQYLFIASIALLIGSFFLANSLSSSGDLSIYFQCVMVPVLFGMVIISVRMTNSWVRPPHPWVSIEEGLKGVGNDATLYNFVMPASHVLVTSSGIFALETRFHDRPQKVTDDRFHQQRGLLTFMRQEQIGDPLYDAELEAARTEVFLQELLELAEVNVQPVVVFTHPNAVVVKEGEQTIPVVYANPQRDKKRDSESLRAFIRETDGVDLTILTEEQIALLDDILLYEDDLAPDSAVELKNDPEFQKKQVEAQKRREEKRKAREERERKPDPAKAAQKSERDAARKKLAKESVSAGANRTPKKKKKKKR